MEYNVGKNNDDTPKITSSAFPLRHARTGQLKQAKICPLERPNGKTVC